MPGPSKPKDPNEGRSWDADDANGTTEGTLSITGGIPSMAHDDGPSHEATEQYVIPSRHPEPVTSLPEFVDAALEVLSGPDLGQSHRVTKTKMVIGRGAEADVHVQDSKISRAHAELVYVGSEFRIRDGGSANGTFLNGSKVVEYAIRSGDKLLVGDTLLQFIVGQLR